jgi:hypothetical protein
MRRRSAVDLVGVPMRLVRALARREVNIVPFILLLLLAGGAAAGAAHEAQRVGDETVRTIMDRLLRRFDLTVLAIMVMVVVLRTAIRTEEDYRAGWMCPLSACGAPRWHYGPAIALSVVMVPVSVFAAAAGSFAVSVRTFAGTAELIGVLPVTLGGGVLLLGTFGVCSAVVGTALRNVSATVGLMALLTLAPVVLTFRYLTAGTELPVWVTGLSALSPMIVPPTDLSSTVRAILYIAGGSVIAAALSHRVAGRLP